MIFGEGRREGREGERPPRVAVLGSLGVHGAALFVVLFATTAPELPPLPPTYRVRLVALADLQAPVRVDPAPPRVEEEEHRPPPPEPTPEPRPRTEEPAVEAELPQPEEPAEEPARTEEEGEETVNVQLDGATFAYPEYLNNIIRQIQRYWRPPAGGRAYRAEVAFVIHRDGKVDGMEWVQRSGSASFDLQAMGAVESAGRARAFGPLPAGFPRDRLRVSFYFDPTGR